MFTTFSQMQHANMRRPQFWVSRSLPPSQTFSDILSRRNQVCIGCGCPRTNLRAVTPCLPSPRFSSSPASLSPTSYSFPTTPQSPSFPPSPVAKTNHPLLTPSGRAFALGGKVQNISNDPLSPCVMYWPDNEPFPEQGQIRPSTLVGVPVSKKVPNLSICLTPCRPAASHPEYRESRTHISRMFRYHSYHAHYAQTMDSNLGTGFAKSAIILIGAAAKFARHVCLVRSHV